MKPCPDKLLLLHALVDGELDAANSAAIETHAAECAACSEQLAQIHAVRSKLADDLPRFEVPASLGAKIETMIADATIASSGSPNRAIASRPAARRWFAGGAITALAASLALFLAVPQLTATGIEDQLISSHVRSLLPEHLVDVETSDRHTVKPWFNGKIDFAPPVFDLTDQGFPLIGGRLDYLEGRVVPALVYGRRLHRINLFIRPTMSLSAGRDFSTTREGYAIVRWADDGLEYWAVSDVPVSDLEQLRNQFRARGASR